MKSNFAKDLQFFTSIISISTTIYFVIKILQDTSPTKTPNPRQPTKQ